MTDCKITVDDLNANAQPAQPLPPTPLPPTGFSSLVDRFTVFARNCLGINSPPVPVIGAVQTIPHPDSVQNVNLCSPITALQIEFSETLLVSASAEIRLFRIRTYDEGTSTWALRYENLDGTPFVGVLPPDLVAQTAQVNVTRNNLPGCVAGTTWFMRETARFDAETGAEESTTTDWVDNTGAITTTMPSGFVFGSCESVCAPTTAKGVGGWGF